jgi:hypothetical protein
MGVAVRIIRVLAIASVAILVLAFPRPSLADHCGGIASVEPSAGPAGTTFVFRTNLGAATNVYLYHDGELVRTDARSGTGSVTYRIRTGPGDEGRWRVRAAVQGHEECSSHARFRVTGPPDTSTPGRSPGGWTSGLALLAGGIAFAWAVRRSPARLMAS